MAILRRALLGAAATAGLARPALAQAAWPTRPIRVVLGFAPGGVGDFTARLIMPKLAEALGQPIVIDNRPSAGGIIAAEAVARSAPDGHTLLLLTTNSTAASLYRSLPYDVIRDFTPIGRMTAFDHVLLTAADSPYRTLQDVFAAARARPGSINIGSISVGNAQHLGAELLHRMAGVELTVVPYRSTPDLVNATATGDVQIASEILAPVLAQIQGGRLRALAMASAARFPLLPEVPTAVESGLPDYIVGSWNGLAGPARLPRAIAERLGAEMLRVLADGDVVARLNAIGVQPAGSSPEAFAAFLRDESARWGRIIEAANIPKQ